MHLFLRKLGLLLPAIVLGYFLVTMAQQWRTDHWLLEDGLTGMALLTNKHWGGHGVYEYEYEVNQKKYTGRSQRNWRLENYRNVGPGGKSIVYYSASHPWLSALDKPNAVGVGWPVVLVALIMEFFLALTVINPKSKWALITSERDRTRQE